jgi:serine/threonine protein kinase
MVAQHPPFTTAQPNDPFYRCLAANRADIFWRTHCKNKPGKEGYFSEEFKDLIQCMLQLESSHRPSMSEILAHPWMQGPVPTTAQLQAEFDKRHHAVKSSIEADKQQKELEKQQRVAQRRTQVMRSAGIDAEEAKFENDAESLMKPKKALEEYEKLFAHKTEFFSTYNPDMIEEALHEHLRQKENVEPVVNDQKYKTKFTLKTQDQGDQEQETEMCVRILKADDQTVCVEFTKIKGNQTRFLEHFTEFKKNVLNFSNDAVIA